ncbi:GlcNAc-PI de-N-acetylase [Maritalea mobilis]|uniref:GlcNAc-PI de-N-acetylase n=1 Tax=Maritalea mobilis TaxID=483324 RepID=A0A4R6VUB0_9HYPH|nr:PIG-L family deacetylase [Maritalea mobilis]TDQ67061.1 GlcNAc-PI de-N-acetylase [Maritalea mobilis]
MSKPEADRLINAFAQPRSVQLWRALLPLKSCTSFMNTGAHPDDEISTMLAALIYRDGINLSHACSTRGEGGQNAIGTETGVDLGVVRTREMERAAEILDMTQYWLCQYPGDPLADFGFSKTGEETLGYWGEERTLERFVWILRTERPDMICTTFLDVPGQHGHHRAMTQSAYKAVKLAADPNAFPEQNLPVWQVKKLYLPAWSGAGDAYDDDLPPPPTSVVMDGSGQDPIIGMDYAQLGQVSRAYHQTQGMGTWVSPGVEKKWPLHLAWTANGEPHDEQSIFDGLPQTLNDLADYAQAPAIGSSLYIAQHAIDQAIEALPKTEQMVTSLLAALEAVREARASCPDAAKAEVVHRLDAKELQLQRALYLASPIRASLKPQKIYARPGEVVKFDIELDSPLAVWASIAAPDGWLVEETDAKHFQVKVPSDAEPSDPLPDIWSPVQGNESVHLRLVWALHGVNVEVSLDPIERLNILPANEVGLEPRALLFNKQNMATKIVERTGSRQGDISIAKAGDFDIVSNEAGLTVTAQSDIAEGLYDLPVQQNGAAAQFVRRMHYPHTGPLVRAEDAALSVRVLDAKLPTGRIGYVAGGSDRVDYWLTQFGLDVTAIDDDALAAGRLDQFDSIIVGVFAFRTRPALLDNVSALHAWVRNGGNLVTLYHRPWDNWDKDTVPLAPIEIGKPSLRWRVTDQNAEVRYLQPDHLLFAGPNKIGDQDWVDWHKERGLYFASSWDSAYTPLLSMNDAGEKPLEGSLLVGEFGKGRHIHTSLILHHQLDRLVPGAYRLMANMLDWTA